MFILDVLSKVLDFTISKHLTSILLTPIPARQMAVTSSREVEVVYKALDLRRLCFSEYDCLKVPYHSIS